MSDQPVFQVRKVFDPKTMSMVEELVQTGSVESVDLPATKVAETTVEKPADKPAKNQSLKSRLAGRKKK